MSQVDDILSGLDFDDADGSARLPFLTPGKYVLGIRKVYIGKGYKGGKFSAEFEVLQSEKATADDNPQPVGKMCSCIFKLGGASKSAQIGPNQVVGFLAAASGYNTALFKSNPTDKDAGKKRIKQLLGDIEENPSMPEGPMVQFGVRVEANCYNAKSQGGTEITPVAFSMHKGFTLAELVAAAKNGTQAAVAAPQ